MGLGKTLSMISLVLKSEEKLTSIPFVPNNGSKNDSKIWLNKYQTYSILRTSL